ncbi:type II toxin-antitoxin system RelE/ParE family toxin [Ruminococcus sp.]|uniref:type II toxin-antitoxin system RelE/ParE family toxin n=1 Tax=Ruminococcus sp. TaxID=41978 RepID=UPI001566A4AD|nr:type II toxin-antitoxin system RelE/ParE family toxin [Ruminococcus sp.]MBE6863392.1 type II toxin-antitoxin system RelE/ParE family toxin [Ruminococcus flavefaciens]
MNKIVYSPKARNDLDEIWTYISEKLLNPSAAEATVNGILDTIDMLQAQAEIGKPLYFSSDLFSGYRFLVYKNYLAFYRTSEDTVYIDRIIYGKRDYMRLLFRDLD